MNAENILGMLLAILVTGSGFALFPPPGGERDGGPAWLTVAFVALVAVMAFGMDYVSSNLEPYHMAPGRIHQ